MQHFASRVHRRFDLVDVVVYVLPCNPEQDSDNAREEATQRYVAPSKMKRRECGSDWVLETN
jgi:hypothetical protein